MKLTYDFLIGVGVGTLATVIPIMIIVNVVLGGSVSENLDKFLTGNDISAQNSQLLKSLEHAERKLDNKRQELIDLKQEYKIDNCRGNQNGGKCFPDELIPKFILEMAR